MFVQEYEQIQTDVFHIAVTKFKSVCKILCLSIETILYFFFQDLSFDYEIIMLRKLRIRGKKSYGKKTLISVATSSIFELLLHFVQEDT